MDFDILGITVLDTFNYINKVHRSAYSSLWLDSRAIHFGKMGKTSQPELSIDMLSDPDMTCMIMYNLWDSNLHIIKVALKSNCIKEVISMCHVFKCHIQGVCKYITGSMVATMVSSYSIGKGYCIDWSSEDNLSRA